MEQFNRTLIQELATCCQESHASWDRKLPLMLMAYRSAEHEATQFMPARLMLGQEIGLPVDLTIGHPTRQGAAHSDNGVCSGSAGAPNGGASPGAGSPEAI